MSLRQFHRQRQFSVGGIAVTLGTNRLHYTRSYVSRIEKKALEELRAMMRKGASVGKE